MHSLIVGFLAVAARVRSTKLRRRFPGKALLEMPEIGLFMRTRSGVMLDSGQYGAPLFWHLLRTALPYFSGSLFARQGLGKARGRSGVNFGRMDGPVGGSCSVVFGRLFFRCRRRFLSRLCGGRPRRSASFG